jgi:peptide-methionine (S)-S-oxide reductase
MGGWTGGLRGLVVAVGLGLVATGPVAAQATSKGTRGGERGEAQRPMDEEKAGAAKAEGAGDEKEKAPARLAKATFGGGCFWCVEAVFERIPGVKSAVSGYAGGEHPLPTYELVCTGETGHAEVVQVTYDPAAVTYEELLEVFFKSHDPTTPNQQGPDVGTQYRSIVLFHDQKQRQAAMKVYEKLTADNVFGAPIVTELVPMGRFFPAEKYHQDYYKKNPNKPYCQMMIAPKLKKLGLK